MGATRYAGDTRTLAAQKGEREMTANEIRDTPSNPNDQTIYAARNRVHGMLYYYAYQP